MNIRNILPWITVAAALITVYLNYVQTREIIKLKKMAQGDCGCAKNGSEPLSNGLVTEQYHASPIM